MLLNNFRFTFTEVQEIFLKIMKEEEDVSAGVAAIRTLLSVIENYKGTQTNYMHLKS